MFGFSVFMNADLTTTDIDAIEEMALQGFSGILHPCIYQKMMPPVIAND